MGFIAMVLTAVVLVHYYLWRRLVKDTTVPGRARVVLTAALVALAALLIVMRAGERLTWGHLLAWPGYLWLAVMFYLFVFLVVLEIPRALALLAVRRAGRRAPEREPERVAVPATAGSAGSTVAGPGAAGMPDSPDVAGSPDATGAAGTEGSQDATRGPGAAGASDAGGDPAGPRGPAGAPVGRRLFIGRTVAAVAGVGALAAVGSGVRTALGDPVIESAGVRLPRLDPRLNGLRLAVVSDIHLGPLTGVGHTERIVRMINSLEADVVAIVGDLVDGTVAELGPQAKPLRNLESRYGSYFVTGNHEYYTAGGPGEWIEELRQLGVRPLQNERVEIAHAGAVLDLAGVNDISGGPADGASGGPDFERALGGRDRSRSTVLLAHQPVQADEAARYGVDLQLSGHTHGGQMAPFNLLVSLQQPIVSGFGQVGDTRVYVTRGAGFWGPPVRVGAPPEITLLELRG
ncbi:metallophosphoesterase [Streptosporangium pseudovulgare]|uniref:metallophosphoesterase n=1 Tax=Streptosporangium pseudovulgare TaxID=35765 RepID=UPI001E4E6697|nr:metallophosphoesterase [Streptosporangium pseudovulgare]